MKPQPTFSPVSVSIVSNSDDSTIEVPKGTSSSLNSPYHPEREEGFPQSWPPTSSDIPPSWSRPQVEEHTRDDSDESFDSPDLLDNDVAWSPAAAFLSSFSPPTQTPAEGPPGYTFGATIGQGAFSTVKEAISPSGGTVAVKIVRHSAFATLSTAERVKQKSRLSREARIWASLSHENVLPLFDSYRDSTALYLITLYCPAGSLYDILKREGRPALEQSDVGYMFRQIVKALRYLHETVRLVHGDVKLENVMVDESAVCRLADFGLTRPIGTDYSQSSSGSDDDSPVPARNKERRGRRTGTNALPVHLSLLRHGPQRHRNTPLLSTEVAPPTHPDHSFLPGSLAYAAPELLLPHSYSAPADGAAGHCGRPLAHPGQDMWALGILLYTLLTGKLPFSDAFEPRLQMKILRGTYDMPMGIGHHAEVVLSGCLERDICKRWTIADVDNSAWGIGYGHIDLDPVLREEQCSQSQESFTPTASNQSFAKNSSSRPVEIPHTGASSTHCPPYLTIHGQSRSPSPSIPPRTPDDEEFDLESGEEGNIQIVQSDCVDWNPHNEVLDDQDVGADNEADLSFGSEDLGEKKRTEVARGRQDGCNDKRKSQSPTRNWKFDECSNAQLRC